MGIGQTDSKSFGQTLSLSLILVGLLISGTGPWLMEASNQPDFFEPCNGHARLELPISSALALVQRTGVCWSAGALLVSHSKNLVTIFHFTKLQQEDGDNQISFITCGNQEWMQIIYSAKHFLSWRTFAVIISSQIRYGLNLLLAWLYPLFSPKFLTSQSNS